MPDRVQWSKMNRQKGIYMKTHKINLCLALVCAALYMVILGRLIPFVYGIIDDRSMMEIVSGQYLGVPDPHTIFLGHWYSVFLAALYTAVPNMDWYALCFLALQAMCMCLIVYRLLCFRDEKRGKAACIIFSFLVFIAFGLQATVQISFTTTAAVLGVTAVFWYAMTEKICAKEVFLLFVLLFLTSQVRFDIFCMTVPVCAVLWIFRVAVQGQRERIQFFLPAAALAVFVLAMLGNLAGYGSAEWRAYKSYDNSRTAIYDFPDYTFPEYEGAEELYSSVGIETKSRARTLINYNYTADDQITPEFFRDYIEAYQKMYSSEQTVVQRLIQSVKDYLKGVRDNRFYMQHLLGLAMYAGLVILAFWKKEWGLLGKTLCTGGIQGIMWIYLLYKGRIPDRVIYSMNLMLLVTAFLLWREIFPRISLPGAARKAGVVACMFVLCYLAGAQTAKFRGKNQELSRWNQNIELLKEYCMEHPDNFYFNDVTSLAFTTYNVRLWRDQPYVMNYMSLGDWMSFSPIWKKKLEQEGIESVKEALYGRNNVYLICSFDKGLEYLISLYPNVECTEVDDIPGFKIYSLESL